MKKIGYLGPQGSFTEEAAMRYTDSNAESLITYNEISELIHAIEEGTLDIGVVPVENSLEGTVNVTVDILVHEVSIQIIGEIILPIQHCLMAKPEATLEAIDTIVSHPQALAQCRRYLETHLPGIPVRPSPSTSAGAKEVKESARTIATIGNRRAAEVFGLKVLFENIQDHLENCTRFIILSKEAAPPTGNDKTSIVFTVDDAPGSLLDALKLFADADINLKKIESRPMRTLLGQYLFLVDLEGHIEEPEVSRVLQLLEGKSKYFKILGSYPRSLQRGSIL